MDQDQFAFFQRLVETTGPSGYEALAQRVWCDRVREQAATIKIDSLGNAIAALNPSGSPRVMVDAHIDEIGFIVKYIDDYGFLYFSTIGGFDASTLPGNRVRIETASGPVLGVLGRKPTHLLSDEDRKRAPELKDMWIDIGAANRQDAEALVAIGDAGGRAAGMKRMRGSLVTANSLDDRVGGYIMAETLRELATGECRAGVFAASSTQEEIGLRGARVSAYDINAEVGIALEVTHATDHPKSSRREVGDVKLGAGPVLSRGANTNPRVFERLVDAAKDVGAPYQVEAAPSGTGTDQNVMQMSRAGMATGLVSVPLRYMHTSSEIISTDDVDATVALLTRFIRNLGPEVDLTP